ncbi:transmembrane transport protein [Streptomyces corchorusii]|uniref:Transmembrane transport protein n=1 Tax=Streptomyces corchorusii TaxID=1903 RepID=A0A101QKW2_STRCK|nr:transmembrane transport protein [Streptomyces corchorusii]
MTHDPGIRRALEKNPPAVKQYTPKGAARTPVVYASANYFGENNNASDYGMVYSSELVSGLVGSGLGAVVVDAWDYHGAFVLAGSIGLASAVVALFLKAPGRPKARRIVPNPHPLGEEMA